MIGEDPLFPASNLLDGQNHGWKSARLASYPQEIVLQFTNVVDLKQIKFLVHESAIPQRLDLYTYMPSGEQANTARIPLN